MRRQGGTAVLIVLSGRPGVGKTTIARRLAAAVDALHIRIDSIEQALRDAGWNVQGEGYSVAYAIAADHLRIERERPAIVIADCVNPWPLTRQAWRTVADRAGAQTLDVEIVCSDPVEHRRRVESRTADIDGHELPTWADVMARDYRPWDAPHLTIDTARLDAGAAAGLLGHAVLAFAQIDERG